MLLDNIGDSKFFRHAVRPNWKSNVFSVVSNGHTGRWNEKPDVIETGYHL